MHNDIRPYTSSDYEQLRNWYCERNLTIVEPDFLPTFGLICPNVCAIFLYKTDCKVASIGSLISNKHSDKNKRSASIDLMIEMLCQKAIQDGFKMITMATVLPVVKARCKKLGFNEGPDAVSNFFRREPWTR